jgi:urease accessory protein
VLIVDRILGSSQNADLAHRLHHLAHLGAVEYVRLSQADIARKRLRVTTDRGRECGIALPREASLFNGAVLHLTDRSAIVVHVDEERWLALTPASPAAAIQLGYHAGNLHWRVRFDGEKLLVALDAPETAYLTRLQDYLDDAAYRWEVIGDGV